MTHPDLNDGFIRLAHELVAAVACAGFSKWEMVVVREVFDQIYGPRLAKTAKLSPSEIAGRLGTLKQSIVRAIRVLVDSEILMRVAECEYRFNKNYSQWKHGKEPRFSSKEIAYCVAAKRSPKEKASNAKGPAQQRSLPLTEPAAEPMIKSEIMGNNGASRRKRRRFPAPLYRGSRVSGEREKRGDGGRGDIPPRPIGFRPAQERPESCRATHPTC